MSASDVHVAPRGQGAVDAIAIPLAVDMDGTLLRVDTLYEAFAAALFKRPWRTLLSLLVLLRGIAPFKARIADLAGLDVTHLPAREDLVDHLTALKAQGRTLHLVSAANERIVQAVAQRFGLFDGVMGSTSTTNLKSQRKRQALQAAFPGGYAYAGDSHADLAVWEGAKSAVLAGASSGVRRQLGRTAIPVEARFDNGPSGGMKAWRKALRLHQWSKNALVIVPLILGHKYDDLSAVLTTLAGFVLIGIVASGTYLVNDMADLSADRRHRTKKNRPFASSALPVRDGLIVAPTLIGGGLLAALALSPAFALSLLAYLVTTLCYTFALKRIALADTVVLALLYTLRLVMGVTLAQTALSTWLISFSLLFFFAMSLAKRHIELIAFDGGDPKARVPGRGYLVGDWPLTLAFGVAASVASTIVLILYVIEDAFPSGVYASEPWLWAAPLAITLFSLRVWFLAHRGELDDDPVAFAIRDPFSIGLGVGMALAFVAAVGL